MRSAYTYIYFGLVNQAHSPVGRGLGHGCAGDVQGIGRAGAAELVAGGSHIDGVAAGAQGGGVQLEVVGGLGAGGGQIAVHIVLYGGVDHAGEAGVGGQLQHAGLIQLGLAQILQPVAEPLTSSR